MPTCPDCHATGQRRVFNAKAPTNLPDLATCPSCHGTGHFADEPPAPAPARRGGSPSESDPPDNSTEPDAPQPPAQD
jgi:hypothetical protein